MARLADKSDIGRIIILTDKILNYENVRVTLVNVTSNGFEIGAEDFATCRVKPTIRLPGQLMLDED